MTIHYVYRMTDYKRERWNDESGGKSLVGSPLQLQMSDMRLIFFLNVDEFALPKLTARVNGPS